MGQKNSSTLYLRTFEKILGYFESDDFLMLTK